MAEKPDINPTHLKIVTDILHKILPQDVTVWVFGSRAKWTAKEFSDLDLALEGKDGGKIPTDIIARLDDDFEESDLPWKVDVVDINAVAPSFKEIIIRDRMRLERRNSEWRVVKLSEIASKITKGTTPSKQDGGFSESGVKYIKAESVGFDGRIDASKFAYITPKIHEKLKRSQLQEGDLLFSMAGVHLGKVGLLTNEHVPANTNQALALIRPITDIVSSLYLFYFLRQKEIVHFVNNATAQSAQPNINLKEIGNLEIRLPSLSRQIDIAACLGALDQKIELNQRMNKTLEEMAQAIFKCWFVDFEPTRAKIAQKEGSGESDTDICTRLKITPKILSLFPATLTNNELGEIPKGWKCKSLRDLSSKISKGTTPRKSELNIFENDETVNFLKVRDISSIGKIADQLDQIPKSIHQSSLTRSILKINDVIFSIAGTIGRVSIIDASHEDINCNQAIAFIRLFEPTQTLELVRMNLLSKRVQDEVQSKLVQGVQANFSLTELGNIEIVFPSEHLLDFFNEVIANLSLKIRNLDYQSRSLSQIRDTLLPKLLSGEISVSEAEHIMEGD